ncbi:hypothetical protein ACTHPH_10520 [Paenibacillus pasadenensis]
MLYTLLLQESQLRIRLKKKTTPKCRISSRGNPALSGAGAVLGLRVKTIFGGIAAQAPLAFSRTE